ncbi:hypothetical protein ACFPRL_22870 [Pseudoclavibacter helvolus]
MTSVLNVHEAEVRTQRAVRLRLGVLGLLMNDERALASVWVERDRSDNGAVGDLRDVVCAPDLTVRELAQNGNAKSDGKPQQSAEHNV